MKQTYEITVNLWGFEAIATVTGDYSPGSPAVMYLRNGDPGYPADPEEFDVIKVILCLEGNDYVLPDPGSFFEQYEEEIYQAIADQYDGGEP